MNSRVLIEARKILNLILEKNEDSDDESKDKDTDTEEDSENNQDSNDEQEETELDVKEESEESEENDETEEDEEEPEVEITTSVEDKIRLSKEIDSELEAVLGDFEMRALKSSVLNLENKFNKNSIKYLIYEEKESDEELDFDINRFTSDVARLIKNYTSLLDMEAIIYMKSKQFLTDKYGTETAEEFMEILQKRHNVDFMKDEPGLENPVAVTGAGGSGGGI
jgi:cobalamin biosynthesis protein CobT